MQFIDWVIVCVPLLIVTAITLYARQYVRGVSDFLAAGRVAGRYVVCVASAEASMGLISVVAIFEQYYKVGFAIGFWAILAAPIGLILTLTGFCIYRYRETRAMTMGQFFEIRYSRRFRVFAGGLQAISGILNYGLFPAVGSRFLVYFLDLPQRVEFLGLQWPTFAVIMFGFLAIGVVISTLGGQITIMVSDCVMGILSYPMYVVVTIAVFSGFSWWDDMAPTLMDRPDGESMLNPFDVGNLRDFNLFFIAVGILGSVYSRMSWSGSQGYNAAAKNAHEQKMGSILGVWKTGFSTVMIVLLAVAAYTFLNNPKYADRADTTKVHLALQALEDVAPEFAPAENLTSRDVDGIVAWENRVKAEAPSSFLTYETISNQMRVPTALRDILPVGILGTFCALMIFLMISTDSTYLHSWGSIIVQDIVLPIRNRAFTPSQQMFWLRLVIVLVATYAFFFSLFFGQMTYILMFFALTGSVYLGGAGAVILGGLYWKKGTTNGAWAAMITGSAIAVIGFLFMNYWAGLIYPWISLSPGLLSGVTWFVESFSAPFEPVILWRIVPDRFFMNGQEVYLLTMLAAIAAYVGVSLLHRKEDFNLDRMLHRGDFAMLGEHVPRHPSHLSSLPFWKRTLKQLSGIDNEFTLGDKIISISVLIYSLGWGFGVSFLAILIWNVISPWPDSYWVNWFFISNLLVGSIVGVVSTFWFGIGGTLDLRAMFRRLKEHRVDDLDDGRVVGNMNADDFAREQAKKLAAANLKP